MEEEYIKKFYSLDPANVSMLGKVINFEEEKEPLKFCNFEFERDNSNLKYYLDLKDNERVLIFKGKERWVTISKEYYDTAFRILNIWKGNPQIFVQKEKDCPVLIAADDFGMAIAPRITEEDD